MTVQDQAQRQRAIEVNESFIVQAPAGSGKTELLIQRYLALLSLVDAPEEIIAITFTRKAAAEMQNRVLTAIESAKSNEEVELEHERLTLKLAKAALQRDEILGWNLIENPARLRIQTIDSLCASLSRQMPLLARLGAQPETVEDPSVLYEQAAINTLLELETGQHWSDAVARLLVHLDNDLPRLKRLLVQMLSKRDQWLRYVNGQHNRQDMEQALKGVIQEHLIQLKGFFPVEYENELCELAHYAATQLGVEKKEHATRVCLNMQQLPGGQGKDLNLWHGVRELLLTRTGNWRKRLNKSDGFPAPSENKEEAELRKSMKLRIEGLLQRLQEVPGLQFALKKTRYLPSPSYDEDEWQLIGALCQLLLLAEAQLRLLFSEYNQMDFTGITQAAISALGEDEVPTDLALHLDYQLHHLLVDEYQDISLNQHILLQRLIAGWSTEEAKSVFLVGDPMQSIYRFREAEVGLFIQTWQRQRLAQVALTPLRLTVNFRSSRALIDWINEQFVSTMPESDDALLGAVQYSPSETAGIEQTRENKSQRAVHIDSFLNRSDIEEAQRVAVIINDLKKANARSSVAILVRSRSHLKSILPALREHNIAYQAIDIDPLANETIIQDLLALTRAYSHLADRIAWLSLLRGPYCGLDLCSMLSLLGQDKSRTVWQCINDERCLNKLNEEAKKRLIRFKILFEQALFDKQRQSLRRSIESLWLNLAGPAVVKDEGELDNAQIFFASLDRLDETGELKDVQQLLRHIESLYGLPRTKVDSDAETIVQIMSMHKAKGLEFDHVLLPGLGCRSRVNTDELMIWMMNISSHEQELIMAPIKAAGEEEGDIYRYLKYMEQNKQSYEDARLLYVAMTRARESLYLFGHANIKEDKKKSEDFPDVDKRSLLAYLWPNVEIFFQKKLIEHSDFSSLQETVLIDQTLHRLPLTWSLPKAKNHFKSQAIEMVSTGESSVIDYEWAGESIKYIGSAVHRFIQYIAEEGIETWNKVKIESYRKYYYHYLRSLGVNRKDLAWASSRVEEALLKTLADERGQWLLSQQHRDVKNEFSLSGFYEKKVISIRIDRTFVDENNIRWIIDYKTSRHEESDIEHFLDQEQERYREQLEKYAVLMQGYDDKPIRLGLYFPLLKGWREWGY